jgi:uncharacterized protein (DUF488 family)
MFYRRKLLLALLQKFGGDVPAIDFQKLLFLFCRQQNRPAYDFVPYKFGCFSFQSYADKRALVHYGILEDDEQRWRMRAKDHHFPVITDDDNQTIERTHQELKELNGDSLVRFVYLKFPYYAIKSEIAHKLLRKNECDVIRKCSPQKKYSTLFSIGYEGKSVDCYFDLLVKNAVEFLFDVRRNPLSMKYGFSKNQLKSIADKLSITYVHIPELGIASDKRKHLNTQEDYDNLFYDYESTTLKCNQMALQPMLDCLNKNESIALTCFEADPNKCHRTRVANTLMRFAKTPIACCTL